MVVSGSFGKVKWTPRDYANFAKETYMTNLIAFRCIDMIAKSVSSVSWKLFQKTGDEATVIENNPINDLLRRANPEESFSYLNYKTVSYLAMAGNVYIEQVRPETGPNQVTPKELYALRPDRIKIQVNETTGQKTAYIYTVGGTSVIFPIDPVTGKSDIMQLKFFHPLDDFYGMAITEPAAREIDTSNSSVAWNKKLTDNSARPGMLLMFEKELADKQYDRLVKDIEDGREGSDYAGKSMILEGARDVKPYGFSPQEMDWIKSNIELARKICIAWGVPAQMIGLPDASTFSNYREARASFWEDTVIYYLNFLKTEYNNWWFEDNKTYIDYILDDVPALQYKRDLMWKRAQESDFLTINEKRGMVGQDPVEGGDTIMIPANLLPLGAEPETEDEIDDEDSETRARLMAEGYTQEEVERALSIYEEED